MTGFSHELLVGLGQTAVEELISIAVDKAKADLAKAGVTATPDTLQLFSAGLLCVAAQNAAGITKGDERFGKLLEMVLRDLLPARH
jgi:hypothetical protein